MGYNSSEGKKWSWLGDTYLIHLYNNNNPATSLEMSLFIERECQTVDATMVVSNDVGDAAAAGEQSQASTSSKCNLYASGDISV